MSLFRIELRKVVRRKDLWVSFGLVAVFLATYFYAYATQNWERYFQTRKRLVWMFLKAYVEGTEHRAFDLSEFTNGLFFTGMAIALSFHLLVPIAAGLIGGIQVAGEAKDGTLRAVLIRPVSRTRLLLAKFGVSVAYVGVLIAVYFGAALALGTAVFGWNRIIAFNNFFMQVGEGRGSFYIMEAGDAFQRLALVCALGGYAMLVVASLALLLSTLSDGPVAPIVGAVGLYFISLILGEQSGEFFQELKRYLFTSHMLFWKHLFAKEIPWDAVRTDLLWCTGYTASFLAAALLVFRYRDVKS